MTQEIRIPDIGDAEEVEVVEILVSSGDRVGESDPIIVIESDKASMEVPAGITGTIDSVTVAVGDKVSEGQVIAKLKSEQNAAQPQPDDEQPQSDDEQWERSPDRESSHPEQQAPEQKSKKEPTRPAEEETRAAPAEEGPDTDQQREVDVKVPDVGEAENVEVIEVAVKEGDEVEEGDMLVVVESDKASMEIPSTHTGTVKAVHVSVGTQVDEGTKLVTLLWERSPDREQHEAAEAKQKPRQPEVAAREADREPTPAREVRDRETAPTARRAEEAAPTEERAPARKAQREAPPSPGAEVYAGPSVRRLARELGVDLSAVDGTGNRGRIVKDDVKAHVKERMAGAAAPAAAGLPRLPKVDFSKFGETEEQPLSRTRASGAQNLHRSWINIPHVTQHDEVDVTDLEDFRASLKAEGEKRGVKVTPIAFIIKACCQVLKEFPTFNASLDPEAKSFILKRYYHIGMAVDTPEGLVVPVIRNADQKGVWELSAEVAELAQKARDRKLSMNDMQGGSFSVSSLGAIGGTGFTPIINPPEVAILGVSRVTLRPVWRSEAFVPRKMLPLSLSYDHRAVNGAEAGRFVARLGELLADIRRLAL